MILMVHADFKASSVPFSDHLADLHPRAESAVFNDPQGVLAQNLQSGTTFISETSDVVIYLWV